MEAALLTVALTLTVTLPLVGFGLKARAPVMGPLLAVPTPAVTKVSMPPKPGALLLRSFRLAS